MARNPRHCHPRRHRHHLSPIQTQVKTTSKLVACKPLKGANTGEAPERGTESLAPHYHHRQPLTCGCLFCLFSLATRKRVRILFYARLITGIVLFQLVSDIFCNHFAILSDCIHIISSTPKISASILVFQVRMSIELLFPLRYPINCAILIYGGILTNICIWSGHASASIISAPFCSHSFRSISPISFRSVPYISLRRYFGANTM